MKQLLSIIIPVYNEKSTIAEVIERVAAVPLPLEKEIIVIDDGSTDGTTEFLRENNGNVRLFLTPVNVGKGAAVRIGLKMAQGDILLIQDADLELDPNEYERLLKPIFDGSAQVVYGSRFLQKNERVRISRRLANHGLTVAANLLFKTRLTDMNTAYKVFTAEVISKINLRANRFELNRKSPPAFVKLATKSSKFPSAISRATNLRGKKLNG